MVGFSNSGSIVANGGAGVRLASAFATPLTNSGTIEASGTAFLLTSGVLANGGVIRSNGGIGLQVTGFSATATNSSTITGATVGVALDSGQFTNSGTISSGQTGVTLGYGTTLTNLAGGTIGGGSLAIGRGGTFGYNAVVQNGGTINGDVDLASRTSFDNSADAFINNGGIVNGNVRLGGGDDAYVTDLGTAGVTGSIDGGDGYDVVRYRVRSAAAVTLAPLSGFEAIDYELIGGAAITISGQGKQTLALAINGVGSADITADLTAGSRAGLTLSRPLNTLIPPTENLPSALSVISRGTLTFNSADQYGYGAVDAGTAKFENAGTITGSAATGAYYQPAAIFGGSEIINSGTINLGGAVGIQGATKVVNRGSIVQIAGTAASQGLVSVNMLDNSGTISVDGPAVRAYFGYTSAGITNSGTIASRTATALGFDRNIVTNLSSGIIRGMGTAIRGDAGTVINQGTIVGDVALGSPSGFYGASAFISDGGTLTGNLTLSGGTTLFLQRGSTSGVSGTITGGPGTDTFGRSFGAATTVQVGGALPTNFERELFEARGAGTVVTLTGPAAASAGDLYLVGEGGFVNRADLGGSVHLTSLARLGVDVGQVPLGSFTNEARIGPVDGSVGTFRNSGTISSSGQTAPVALELDGNLTFANSGTISGEGLGYPAVNVTGTGIAATLTNTGTIAGGADVEMQFALGKSAASLSFDNAGTITRTGTNGTALTLFGASNQNDGSITLQNSGRIATAGQSAAAVSISTYNNTGPDQPHAATISVTNTGTIEATGSGRVIGYYVFGKLYTSAAPAAGLTVFGDENVTARIVNAAGGTIVASGKIATAVTSDTLALELENAGTISGTAGGTYGMTATTPGIFVAGAIHSAQKNDRVVNSGTIVGSIDLGAGNDRLENTGTIMGDVFLGSGDDVFVHRASATIVGIVDAGIGTDVATVDATGDGTISASQFVNFEQLNQVGAGNVTYSGRFSLATLGLADGTASVAQGQTLGTLGPIAITGGAAMRRSPIRGP